MLRQLIKLNGKLFTYFPNIHSFFRLVDLIEDGGVKTTSRTNSYALLSVQYL